MDETTEGVLEGQGFGSAGTYGGDGEAVTLSVPTGLAVRADPGASASGDCARSENAGGTPILFSLPSQPNSAGGIGAGSRIEIAAITAD